MLDKVAVDKLKIYELIRLKRYKEAFMYIEDVRKVIELAAKKRINKFIEEKIILKDEELLFLDIVEKDINNKLLEDKNYVLMNEMDVNLIKDKFLILKSIINRRKRWKVNT